MLKRLSHKQLQELIGEDTLERIKNIIPSIPNSGIEFADQIYDNKQLLIKIFESFSGADSLYLTKFRETLFSCFSKNEIDELCLSVDIPTSGDFQSKVKKLVSIPWGNNEATIRLIKQLDLPESCIPPDAVNLPNIECVHKPDVPFRNLLDYQVDVSNRALESLSHPYSHFIIQMPTGSGKTRTTMEIIAKELLANPTKSIVWLAHSEELCEQAVECFKEIWEHLGAFDVDIMRVWGVNNLQPLQRTTFIVAGLQKLYSILKHNSQTNKITILAQSISLIIVDEAHKSIAPTYKKVIDALSGEHNDVRVIGLTATPGRGYINSDTSETEKLHDYYNNEIISIDSGDKAVFAYLRDRGILSKIIREPLKTDMIIKLTDAELKLIEKFYDYPDGVLNRLANDDSRNREIVLRLKELCDRKKKILFFASSLDHSKFICAILVFLGYRAEHIDGSTRRERRSAIIDEFKAGKIDVICNFGVLTTGFDAPKTDVVFIARPTLSVVLYSQMIGRGIRGPAIGGTETCIIVDVVDNIANYTSPDLCYEYFKTYGE